MENRERFFSLRNIDHPDPTAWHGIRQAGRSTVSRQTPYIPTIQDQLKTLERERRSGSITRSGFEQERASLLALSVVFYRKEDK